MKALSQTHLSFVVAFGLSGVLAFGCAKKREASLPEDQVAGTFSMAELQEAQFKLKTTEGKKASIKNEALLGSEKNTVIVDTQGVPERFLFLFRNLEILGKKSEEIQVIFGIDRNHVTAYKLVRSQELSSIEKSLALSEDGLKNKVKLQKLKIDQKLLSNIHSKITAENSAEKAIPSLSLVPLFKFKVTAHGTVEKVKNELKEETSVLKLKKSEWEASTHIQVSDLSHERLNIEIDPALDAESENFLITEKVNKKSFSKSDLSELLGTEIRGSQTDIYTVSIDAKLNSIQVFSTPEKNSTKEEHVITLNAEQMDAQLNLDKGQETNTITFKKVNAEKLGTFTKILKPSATK